MSRRVVLAIGCDKYDFMGPLDGAEKDASRIHEALIDPAKGECDPTQSAVLLSPKFFEVQAAINAILADPEPIDTFTFFFAGHGVVKKGSFYMCVSDSNHDFLSANAISLSNLFVMLGEKAPGQSNIIIDACESGGLIADLNALLKPDNLGRAGSPGITLVAMAASDEGAGDTPEGGVGTNAVLDCINGVTFIDDTSAYLDLIDIGRSVWDRLASAGGQNPVVWGLNLFGPRRFCRNPKSTVDAAARAGLVSWPDAHASQVLRDRLPALWRIYSDLDRDWDARRFFDVVQPVLSELAQNPSQQLDLIDRFLEAALQKAQLQDDAFIEIEIAAACAVSMLPFSETAHSVAHVDILLEKLTRRLEEVLDRLIDDLEAEKFALMAPGNAMAELFYLPLRISRVLGWAAFAHLYRALGPNGDQVLPIRLVKLAELMVQHYHSSFVFMSEAQAPFVAVLLAVAKRAGLVDIGKVVVGCLTLGMVRSGCRAASANIEYTKVLDFLLARATNDFSASPGLYAKPSEFALVVLRGAAMFDIEDQVDRALHHLDRVSTTAFLPAHFDQFANELIRDGSNVNFRIGFDAYTVDEIERSWPSAAVVKPATRACFFRCILASLLFPNRVPWFLLERAS